MSQDSSLAAVFEQLRKFAKFPKYSLERRIDILLTPFLEPYLSKRMEAPVELVAPEFPIKLVDSNLSVNVDYLLRRGGDDPAWIFLELKMDQGSLDPEQLNHYYRARGRGMRGLLEDIECICRPRAARDGTRQRAATRHRAKYEHLLETVKQSDPRLEKITLAYLSPCDPEGKDVRWFPLDDFARSWQPTIHMDLWAEVSSVLGAVKCDPT